MTDDTNLADPLITATPYLMFWKNDRLEAQSCGDRKGSMHLDERISKATKTRNLEGPRPWVSTFK
jgi:hypothetical protein